MTWSRLQRSARARLEGRRQKPSDEGFALIFVLPITTVIMIGVLSVLVVTASQIVPAKTSQNKSAANAAAEAGIQNYVAFLSAKCSAVGLTACASITATAVNNTVVGADGSGRETYTTTAMNPTSYISDGFLRVKSVGTSSTGSTTLVADLVGLPNVLRFAYLSKYETLGSSFLNSYYPARSISVTNQASATASGITRGSAISWNGPTSSAPLGDDVCDQLWYDDPSNTSSGVNGRSTIKGQRTSLTAGYDWGETSASGRTLLMPCEVTFSSGMAFNGPVYTKDAPYLSNSTPGGNGPTFTSAATDSLPALSTRWSTVSNPAAASATPYRSFPYVGGAPSSSSGSVQYSKFDLQLPNSVADMPTATCTYTGPTRIVVTGSTATITSPLTPAVVGSACYASNASISGSGVVAATVNINNTLIYVKNIGTDSTKWTTSSASNPLFQLTSAPGSPGNLDSGGSLANDSCSATSLYSLAPLADCAWTNVGTNSDPSGHGWTAYTTSALCGSTPASDRQTFECEFNHQRTGDMAPGNNQYGIFRSRVQIDLTRGLCLAGTAAAQDSCLTNTITGELLTANSGQRAINASGASPGDHQYVVTPLAPVVGATGASKSIGTASGAPSTDPFYTNAAGSKAVETVSGTQMTFSIGRQVYGCYNNGNGSYDSSGLACLQVCVLGVCTPAVGSYGWGGGGVTASSAGKSVPQFQTTISNATWGITTPAQGGTSSFPTPTDITPYKMWSADKTQAPGDVYIEGTNINSKLSVVADNDVVVSGKLTSTAASSTNLNGEPAWSAGGAVDLVAVKNVRVYHPVSCADQAAADLAATTATYCPNDITGLYTGGLEANGALLATHPSLQYCNLTAATTGGTSAYNAGNANCAATTSTGSGPVSTVNAAVFALNGSVLTDNYNRAVNIAAVNVSGGVYQLHRGATGEEWELASTETTVARPSSGYKLQINYLDYEKAGLPYVPALQSGSSTRAWNVVSVSSGG